MKIIKILISFALMLSLVGCAKKTENNKEPQPEPSQKQEVEKKDTSYYQKNLLRLKYRPANMIAIVETIDHNVHYTYKIDQINEHLLVEVCDKDMKKPPLKVYDLGDATIMMVTLELAGFEADTYYQSDSALVTYQQLQLDPIIYEDIEELVRLAENVQLDESKEEDGVLYDYISYECTYELEEGKEQTSYFVLKIDSATNEIVSISEKWDHGELYFVKDTISIGDEKPVPLSDENFDKLFALALVDFGYED